MQRCDVLEEGHGTAGLAGVEMQAGQQFESFQATALQRRGPRTQPAGVEVRDGGAVAVPRLQRCLEGDDGTLLLPVVALLPGSAEPRLESVAAPHFRVAR